MTEREYAVFEASLRDGHQKCPGCDLRQESPLQAIPATGGGHGHLCTRCVKTWGCRDWSCPKLLHKTCRDCVDLALERQVCYAGGHHWRRPLPGDDPLLFGSRAKAGSGRKKP